MPVTIRHLRKADIPAVVECERLSHAYTDEDFDVPQVREYAWGEEDIYEVARQYKSSAKRTGDTRLWVVTVPDHPKKGDEPWVCGAIAYVLDDDGYDVYLFTAHPAAPDTVRPAMLAFLTDKARASSVRKKLVVNIDDGNYASLKFFMNNGFSAAPDRAKGMWKCVLAVEEDAARPAKPSPC